MTTRASRYADTRLLLWAVAMLLLALLLDNAPAFAHDISQADRAAVARIEGPAPAVFLYLGAKHMVTGYDHLLFLLGVIFFLYKLRDVGLYVTLFAIGHSLTLITGVLTGVRASAFLIDAVIGLSVAYKALDNLGAFKTWFGFEPDARAATLIFGFFHGFGLATKILDYEVSPEGLLPNLIAFNVGVELGQLFALSAILIAMSYWRLTPSFGKRAYSANVAILAAGFVLMGYQLVGYFVYDFL